MKLIVMTLALASMALALPQLNKLASLHGTPPPRRIEIPNARPLRNVEDLDDDFKAFPATKPVARNYVPNAYEREQNQAAKYEFMSDVEDHISDLTQQRTEQRDGLSVKGMYSYSDGYYKRTVHYVADENGYRVLGMEAVPLADGPQIDLSGTASVSNAAHGTHLSYKVQSVPVEGPVGKIIDRA